MNKKTIQSMSIESLFQLKDSDLADIYVSDNFCKKTKYLAGDILRFRIFGFRLIG